MSVKPTSLSIEVPVDVSGPCDTDWPFGLKYPHKSVDSENVNSKFCSEHQAFSPSVDAEDAEQVGIGFAWAYNFNVSLSIFETGWAVWSNQLLGKTSTAYFLAVTEQCHSA